ncbi:MAG: YdcF family protein [Lachnospiraceae bacterium]|nr:YdcF family protein [Lachnospiraceae bacterium]
MTVVVIFNIFFALLLGMIIAMQFLLQRTLHRSLYYYRNAVFIAGILFLSMLMLSLYSYLLSCLMETKELTLRYLFIEFVRFPKRFSVFAIPLFTVICLIISISNLALIRHEGLRLKNILGVVLGILVIGGTVAIHAASSLVESQILTREGILGNPYFVALHTYLNLFLLLMMCYFECFFLGTVVMAYLAARQKPRYDKDFIIILGCSIDKKGGLRPLLKARTNRAIRYAWDQEIATGKPVTYIPSGGQGEDEIMSEGSAMELYLLAHGAESEEVHAEKRSRNTYENFLFSKQIIDELNPEAKVCFATTNYHMFRSGVLAKRVGLDAEGIASRTKWYFWPNGFVREFFAILDLQKKEHLLATGIIFAGCFILAIFALIFRLKA